MRLANGAEALIVRVVTHEGIAGYGFTFCENVAAARAMACWDAASQASHRPLWQLLREIAAEDRATLEASAEPGRHPWSVAWRAALAGVPEGHIDWTLEPGFKKLHWVEPQARGGKHDG